MELEGIVARMAELKQRWQLHYSALLVHGGPNVPSHAAPVSSPDCQATGRCSHSESSSPVESSPSPSSPNQADVFTPSLSVATTRAQRSSRSRRQSNDEISSEQASPPALEAAIALADLPLAKRPRQQTSPSDTATNSQPSGQLYRCPWPGCFKTFKRIKSRSAHLKWHGGDWRHLSKTQRRASSTWPPPSQTSTQDEQGALSQDQAVLVMQTDAQGIARYEKATVVAVEEQTVTVMVQGKEQQVDDQQVLPDVAPEHQQLQLGMRVCAVSATSDPDVYWPGTVHRIERTRARVNFDAHPLAWRKAHDMRLLPL
eukprot:TRINITY_DN9251_c0_g1_i1.p1 TRINITY_DN9251_c0_g1~~TRINITY_DN9251_c0_g1_i1.p1  ORF type:complete len:314 (+),score=64.40 TRINITY_DN9251_c0_g1_i1:169-1110(+)